MTAEIIPFPDRPTLWERADAKRKRDRDDQMRQWCRSLCERDMADMPDGDPKGAA